MVTGMCCEHPVLLEHLNNAMPSISLMPSFSWFSTSTDMLSLSNKSPYLYNMEQLKLKQGQGNVLLPWKSLQTTQRSILKFLTFLSRKMPLQNSRFYMSSLLPAHLRQEQQRLLQNLFLSVLFLKGIFLSQLNSPSASIQSSIHGKFGWEIVSENVKQVLAASPMPPSVTADTNEFTHTLL